MFFGLRPAKNKRKWRYPNWMELMHPLGIPYYGLRLGCFIEEEEKRALEEESKALKDRLSLIKMKLARLEQQKNNNGDSLDYIASHDS